MVELRGTVICPTERLAAVRLALAEHIRLTRQEVGCQLFDVTEDAQQPGLFHVHERFDDARAFEAHQTRTAASEWAEITQGLPRDYTVTGLET